MDLNQFLQFIDNGPFKLLFSLEFLINIDSMNADYNQHRFPRGSHPLNALTITRTPTGGPPAQFLDVGDTWEVNVCSTFTGPLFLGPFLFHSKYNEAGLFVLGINTMNFVFHIDAQMKRFWSSGNSDFPKIKKN